MTIGKLAFRLACLKKQWTDQMERMRFGSKNLESLLVSNPERLEELPFGAVKLDREGFVKSYNRAQGVIWGRLTSDVLDRPFFDEVAPCCRNTPVQFAFNKYRERGFVETIYEHEVPYKGRLIDVKIHVKAVASGEYCWIFSKLMSVSDLPKGNENEPSGEAA